MKESRTVTILTKPEVFLIEWHTEPGTPLWHSPYVLRSFFRAAGNRTLLRIKR